MKTAKKLKLRNFQDFLKEQLKDPVFKNHYDEHGKKLEVAYSILQLRKELDLSQKDLANKLRTSQSNIARAESGNQNVTVHFLQKIAKATNRNLKIQFVKSR